jgi:HKD family nuclease
MGAAIEREIYSADSIDLLCAFIRWNGFRVIRPALEGHRLAGRPLRVITTVYTGSTERRALDWLSSIGAEVKVSYDTRTTRLHAKAWLFERLSGFSSAFIGSSNLTHSAMLDGVEWNVRLAQAATPDLIDKFKAAFESYWENPDYETYDPGRDAERFDRAIRSPAAEALPIFNIDVQPWPYQREMLQRLERVYTGDQARVSLVLQALQDNVTDPRTMRALGFCVSVDHARFMADEFSRRGLPAVAVSADTPSEERESALRNLRDSTVKVVFCVDLFNEGVDVPEVDTVLFLRPTESALVFLQQLGRGLRRTNAKACLTVLDFIGGANRRFRFDLRFRALLGGHRSDLIRQIEWQTVGGRRGWMLKPSAWLIFSAMLHSKLTTSTSQTVGRGPACVAKPACPHQRLGPTRIACPERFHGSCISTILAAWLCIDEPSKVSSPRVT